MTPSGLSEFIREIHGGGKEKRYHLNDIILYLTHKINITKKNVNDSVLQEKSGDITEFYETTSVITGTHTKGLQIGGTEGRAVLLRVFVLS